MVGLTATILVIVTFNLQSGPVETVDEPSPPIGNNATGDSVKRRRAAEGTSFRLSKPRCIWHDSP